MVGMGVQVPGKGGKCMRDEVNFFKNQGHDADLRKHFDAITPLMVHLLTYVK